LVVEKIIFIYSVNITSTRRVSSMSNSNLYCKAES
jgi:hypothetical protein